MSYNQQLQYNRISARLITAESDNEKILKLIKKNIDLENKVKFFEEKIKNGNLNLDELNEAKKLLDKFLNEKTFNKTEIEIFANLK